MSIETDSGSSTPTTEISECLEALRLAVTSDNQPQDTCTSTICQRDEEPLDKDDVDHEPRHEQPFEEHYELISNHDNTYDDSSLEEQQQSQATMNSTTTNQHYRSCRQEACYYPSDITVDELAGYLDELLYIPRPMSDMAELMYT